MTVDVDYEVDRFASLRFDVESYIEGAGSSLDEVHTASCPIPELVSHLNSCDQSPGICSLGGDGDVEALHLKELGPPHCVVHVENPI